MNQREWSRDRSVDHAVVRRATSAPARYPALAATTAPTTAMVCDPASVMPKIRAAVTHTTMIGKTISGPNRNTAATPAAKVAVSKSTTALSFA